MKTLIAATIPAALALGACSDGGDPDAVQAEAAVVAADDNDAVDPDDDPAMPMEEEHADDHAHDGEDADHAH